MMTFGAARDAAAALRVHHVSALPRNWGARDGPAGRKRSLAPCQSQWLGSWLHRRAWGGIARRQPINPRAVDYVPQYVSGRMLRPTEALKVTHVRRRRPRRDFATTFLTRDMFGPPEERYQTRSEERRVGKECRCWGCA